MKKDQSHKVLFFIMLMLLGSGVALTYNQYQIDQEIDLFSQAADESEVLTASSELDTLQFIINPSYEYQEFSCLESEGSTCDVLRKTVVTVDQKGLESTAHSDEFSKLPANASLNLMLETYTIKRQKNGWSTSYFVTVESFDTNLENAQPEIDNDISAMTYQLTADELYQLWRTGKAEQLLSDYINSPRPY